MPFKNCPHPCNRQFESLVVNAVYCCARCRRRAARLKERDKVLRVEGPADSREPADNRIIAVLTFPTLAALQAAAIVVRATADMNDNDRAIEIFGAVPEGWIDPVDDSVFVVPNPKPPAHWSLVAPRRAVAPKVFPSAMEIANGARTATP